MKVLVAIEDKRDASAIVEAIHNREWPSDTQFVFVHVLAAESAITEEGLNAGVRYENIEYNCRLAYKLLLDTAHQIKTFMPESLTETYVCYGEPSEEILSAVNEEHPETVVIGSHSRDRLRRLFRKSVSEAVVQRIPRSVGSVHIIDIPELTLGRNAPAAVSVPPTAQPLSTFRAFIHHDDHPSS
jgi:nucleotide-binding universal stress UspA family protein